MSLRVCIARFTLAMAACAFGVGTFAATAQTINTIAGNGIAAYVGDGGAATSASLNHPENMAIDASGNIYVADVDNHVIRKIRTDGTIITVAGTGTAGFSGDGGAAISATLNQPEGVAFDKSGNLLIADSQNRRIRKVNSSGIISTICGTGVEGHSGDGGPATSAMVRRPIDLAFDASGNLYIADSVDNTIRKIDTGGTITTVVGNTTYGYSGDGGPATAAQMATPVGVALDTAGNIYVADGDNYRIRMVNASGIITTVVGNGLAGYAGDGGIATSASLNIAFSMRLTPSGQMYIADAGNNRIRSVVSGIINTIAGNGSDSFFGDGGPALFASLSFPWAVAIDNSGNILIGDRVNNRIRKVTFNSVVAPTVVSVTPSAGSGSSQTFQFAYSDTNGVTDIASAMAFITGTGSLANGCGANYNPSLNQVMLMNDSGTAWSTPATLGSGGALQNSQCTISVQNSSASAVGANLTLNLAISFQPAFAGNKVIFMNVMGGTGLSTNWQPMGTFAVTSNTNHPPSAVSVTPQSGSGSTTTLTLLFSDPDGASDLNFTAMFINSATVFSSGCITLYQRSSNQILLMNDAGTGWIGPGTIGAAGTLQNTQCTLNLQASSSAPSGTNLTLTLALSFNTSTFLGAKSIYLLAVDNGGLNTNWQPMGTFAVTSNTNHPPSAVSVTPQSGSGSTTTLTLLFSDPDGASDLNFTAMFINSATVFSGGCITLYQRSSNQILLMNDAGTGWIGPGTIGAAGTLQNTQCTLNLQASSSAPSGTNLTLTLAVSFNTSTFLGAKSIYLLAVDNGGLDSGWQGRGAWTVQ